MESSSSTFDDEQDPVPAVVSGSGKRVDKVKHQVTTGGGGDKGTTSSTIDDPELDALLNDALQDFGKVPQAAATLNPTRPNLPGGAGNDEMNQVWTEEFIKEATAQFEKKMRECLVAQQQQGQGQGGLQSSTSSPLTTVTQDLNKVVEAATQAAVGAVVEPSAVMSQINEAMKNVNFNPATAGLGGSGAFNDDELTKLMNSFGMGMEGGEGDDAELDEFLPFMTNFMQKLLSKDMLYPVLTDIVDRYPEWLADNRPKLSNEDFDKYNRQYGFMKVICEEYALESPSDNEETKRKRFDRISELMIKVQCCGSPPKDLIGEDGTFPSMDPAAAFASMGMPGSGSEQCSIV